MKKSLAGWDTVYIWWLLGNF